MKTRSIACCLILIAVASLVFARPHGRGKSAAQQAQAQAPATPPATSPTALQPASTRLSQFTAAHLDHILGPIDQPVALPRTELSQLRASLVEESVKAPDTMKAQYQSAVAVCDAISSAMDERQNAITTAQSAGNGPVSQDVHDARVSLPRHGRGSGRAARAARHQQQDENNQNTNDATQKGAFLDSVHNQQWTDRAAILRQRIQQLQSRELQAESAAMQAAPTTSPAK